MPQLPPPDVDAPQPIEPRADDESMVGEEDPGAALDADGAGAATPGAARPDGQHQPAPQRAG